MQFHGLIKCKENPVQRVKRKLLDNGRCRRGHDVRSAYIIADPAGGIVGLHVRKEYGRLDLISDL